MKKLLYLLTFFLPVIVSAQQNWYKSSPLDYMWMNVGNAAFSAGEAEYASLAFSPSDGQPYVAFQYPCYHQFCVAFAHAKQLV